MVAYNFGMLKSVIKSRLLQLILTLSDFKTYPTQNQMLLCPKSVIGYIIFLTLAFYVGFYPEIYFPLMPRVYPGIILPCQNLILFSFKINSFLNAITSCSSPSCVEKTFFFTPSHFSHMYPNILHFFYMHFIK